MFHVPEQYRVTSGRMASVTADGNNGLFLIPHGSDVLQCIASDGNGWDHVSLTVKVKNRHQFEVPSWDIMCWIKDTFWDKEDWVAQFHPAHSEYVNNHPYVLHLWRPTEQVMPKPMKIMVGI